MPSEVNWACWSPKEEAVLCFVRNAGEILLIEKKRGLGMGKVNGPGGRIEPGETAEQAAVRETQEEVGITPQSPQRVAKIDFQFIDGYALRCFVFLCDSYEGKIIETDEAKPFWVKETAIPYDRMWADDRHWLPLVLHGQKLDCCFHFDGDEMLEMKIKKVQEIN